MATGSQDAAWDCGSRLPALFKDTVETEKAPLGPQRFDVCCCGAADAAADDIDFDAVAPLHAPGDAAVEAEVVALDTRDACLLDVTLTASLAVDRDSAPPPAAGTSHWLLASDPPTLDVADDKHVDWLVGTLAGVAADVVACPDADWLQA